MHNPWRGMQYHTQNEKTDFSKPRSHVVNRYTCALFNTLNEEKSDLSDGNEVTDLVAKFTHINMH